MINKTSKIYVAGYKGMEGSAVWRALEKKGYSNLLGKTSAELDLRNQEAVYNSRSFIFFNKSNSSKLDFLRL